MTPLHVILDTNCLVSALIFAHGKAGQLRLAWQSKQCVPLVCRETVTELIRVLGYPKFKLRQNDIDLLLADILPWTKIVASPLLNKTRQLCDKDDAIFMQRLRDRDDAVFIHLARANRTDFLVSGDRHLLELRTTFPALNIVSPAEFLKRLSE